MKVAKGPMSAEEVGRIRVTRGVFEDKERFEMTDFWRTCKEPHKNLKKLWTGSTTFTDHWGGQECDRVGQIVINTPSPRGGVEI